MERTSGKEPKDIKSERDTKPKDHHPPGGDAAHKTPKKRRKVNHACLYCRRSERPCTRCIKRNIGHLCHDEPRDQDSRKSKSVLAASSVRESDTQSDIGRSTMDQTAGSMGPPPFDTTGISTGHAQAVDAAALGRSNPLQLVQPTAVSGIQPSALSSNMNQFTVYPDSWLNNQNHYHDMHNYSNFVITPEVTNEFNLLNEFLQTSLLDESNLLPDALGTTGTSDGLSAFPNTGTGLLQPGGAAQGHSMLPPNAEHAKTISRPPSVMPSQDKAREYYLQAADPSGNDTPEERMQRVLKAKYDAGLLKPFNYIKGYQRLSSYLDTHVAPASKQKILRQLDRFRPKFREKMHTLTDMDLVLVEMWFERTLMEFDRVFASMAVPACCWRRTGEIFRGNKEMAELINVPVESLRGGKIALHEILTEDSNVRYWEEFGTIAFDPAHDTLLTACSLKNPDDKSNDPVVNCCFSFRIRRDDHKIFHSSKKAEKHVESALGMYLTFLQTSNSFQSPISVFQGRRLILYAPSNHFISKTASLTLRSSEFTKTLLKQFSSGDLKELPAIHQLTQEIRDHVDKLHTCQERYLPGISGDPEIDEMGTKLWNVCTRLKRDYCTPSSASAATNTTDSGEDHQVGEVTSTPAINGPVPGTGVIGVVEGTPPNEAGGGKFSKNNNGSNQRVKRLVVYGRVLALHLLVLGKKPAPKEQHKSIRAARELIRLMKLVLKAGRDCVEFLSSTTSPSSAAAGAISAGNNTAAKVDWREDRKKAEKEKDTKLATMVMEIAAECKGVLQDFQQSSGKQSGKEKEGFGKASLDEEEVNECNCLEVEYFILRTALSWVDKRPDVAEHMYTKAERLHKFLTPNYAEKLADVLYEIGKSFSVEKDFLPAVKWLERANEILNTQSLEKLSREGVELRLAILQATVTAYLGMETPSALEKARKIVDYVESELGSTKLLVSLLRLEVLRRTPPEEFDDEAYSEVLRRMIRSFNSTDSGLKLITHHIQKLQKKSPGAACAVMDELINRLREAGENLDWMEMVVVQRMWMIQHAPLSLESFETVKKVLSLLRRPFGPMACMATQGLMWRKLELCYHGGLYDLSEQWGHLALHPIFDQCGNQNRSKIERKLLMCALARNNMDAAVSVIQNISNKNWNNEPMTAYLAFKVAIRVKDRDLAERCLEAVSQTKEHIDYLGACIAESQKAEDIESAISGLKKLHDKYERKASPGGKIHLPALFRCSIRLLNCLLESPEYQDKKENIVNELCLEFESVLYSTMRKLVNEIWLLETFDAVKLAKYTRCLFQATLPLDDTLAMNLLDEACKKARELGASPTNNWPDEELEWMATVSFNHAIDCYGAREMERSRLWATKAIELAHYCHDEEGGGLGLERAMQKKFASMKFDRRPKPPRGEDIDLMEDIQPGGGG
ncbi:Meiosis protein SPO22/ZIP4 like domain containing protein [Rhypophila decipiens]